MSGIIEDIVKKVKSFHGNVETFLDARIKEATATRTIITILVAILVGGLIGVSTAPAYGIAAFGQGALLLPGVFLFIALFMALNVWIVKKINYQGTKMKQPPWINVLYPYFMLVAASMCLSLILPIPYNMFVALQPALDVIGLLIQIAFFYCLLTLFLRLFNPSVIEFIEFLVISNITGFVLVIGLGALIFVVGASVLSFGHYIYSFPVINHPDGSFTIEYNAPDYQFPVYTFRGNSECNVTFPKGWQISNPGEVLDNYTRWEDYPPNISRYGLIYKTSSQNSSPSELVFFNTLPPEDNIAPELANNTIASLSRSLPDKSADSMGFLDKNVSFKTNEQGTTIIDVEGVSEDGLRLRHSAFVVFKNHFLAEFYYESPYEEDGDFFYILESIKCG